MELYCTPLPQLRALCEELLPFCRADDRDEFNKNIFYYFFGAVVYCWLAADISKTAFIVGEERLPGDYGAAMNQRVENGRPKGFIPLHVLTNQSGISTVAVKIIEDRIDYGIVPLTAFSDWRNDAVSVFLIRG